MMGGADFYCTNVKSDLPEPPTPAEMWQRVRELEDALQWIADAAVSADVTDEQFSRGVVERLAAVGIVPS